MHENREVCYHSLSSLGCSRNVGKNNTFVLILVPNGIYLAIPYFILVIQLPRREKKVQI